jgi:protein dithiol oxidoreductase (disulfide-forming)
MFRWVSSLKWIAIGFAAFSLNAGAQQQFVEGKDYTRLKNPQQVESGAKIEVIEFFSYGCPHCRDLEEHLGPWIKKAPDNVSFKRVPVVFQPAWNNFAKISYTLETLGRDDLSVKVFQAIHSANLKLNEEKVFFDWAKNNGLDENKLKEVWNSFSVNSKVNRGRTLAANYSVDGVPMLFVDGKFKLQPGNLRNSHKDVPAALDFLIAKARSERK